jgi:hypothetical protein
MSMIIHILIHKPINLRDGLKPVLTRSRGIFRGDAKVAEEAEQLHSRHSPCLRGVL